MSSTPVCFCLIGAGRIARVHAHNLRRNPRARLRYVVEPVREARDALTQASGAEGLVDLAPALADPQVDAVLIASPTQTHLEYVLAASAAGKAVFCEKPLDLDLERIRTAAAQLQKAEPTVFMGFNRRFDPQFAELKRRLDGGEIGRPELIVITSRDPRPPPVAYAQSSGGLFRDMMIHDLDMARFLLGEEPSEVTASASCLVSPELAELGDVDTAIATLRTRTGTLCCINNSRRSGYGYDQRVEVLGASGMLQAQNLGQHTLVTSTPAGVKRAAPVDFFLERYDEAYARELDAFLDALATRSAMSPSLYDGQQALLLADACARSQREARTIYVTTP